MIIYLVLLLIILKNIKFIKEKIEKLKEDIYDPFTVVTFMLIWITITIYVLVKYKVFDKDFYHIGPPTPDMKPLVILGNNITTWNQIYLIIGYSIISEIVSTFGHNIIVPWRTNTINDKKTSKLDRSKGESLYILNGITLFAWVDNIIKYYLLFTKQLQFIIPRFITHLIVYNNIQYNYIKNKET